ncbi:helix-hairpin-helix domain-containing protein [Arthrobacter sp. BE255]|uniref:helix-hairpin-helix domain-containing protein n=1 Tax=Arthrobacter sp. BE255 TaxID=2817721 RepID=UPI0028552FEA|nr:helix-hairpin-helix domain-containing protein [Arthrobacter sp. BE255]MDR7158801.1 competence protein ComEA [Arthrobacter sp. BE255]
MSRRDAGSAASPAARHAGRRLQATLGSGSGGLLPGGGEGFIYGGGSGGDPGPADGAGADAPPGTLFGPGRTGPVLRWRLGLRVAVLVGIAAVVCGTWFWWQVSIGRPDVLPLSDATPSGSAAPARSGQEPPGTGPESPGQAGADAGPGGAAPAVLHVAGAVARPGVVELGPGSRVHDAIAAAGGGTAAADLDRLNLAAVVVDGQKIYVPRHGEPLPADSAGAPAGEAGGSAEGGGSVEGGAGPRAAAGKINLNAAGIEELGTLPKVGPVLAQRIVDWRKEHGLFTSVEELDAVDGVGPKMLETLLPLVSVE